MKHSTLAIHAGLPGRASVPPDSRFPAFPNAATGREPDARDSAAEGLQRQIAALQGGDRALACSSGMAALYVALLAALSDRPRNILAANVMFGQAFRLMRLMGQQGVRAWLLDICNPESLKRALDAVDAGCILLSFPKVFFKAQQFKLTVEASVDASESRTPERRRPQPSASVTLIDQIAKMTFGKLCIRIDLESAAPRAAHGHDLRNRARPRCARRRRRDIHEQGLAGP